MTNELLARGDSTKILFGLRAAIIILALAGSVRAGTFSSSTVAPAVDATDIANLAKQAGSDKWFFQSANESGVTDAAKGQTFTTGSSARLLKALTYKIDPGQKKAAPTTYTIRVGRVSGTNFTLVASETCTQTADTPVGAYMTWTLASPVTLLPNTAYGVDVAMKSGTTWQSGIPYLAYTGNTNTPRVGVYYDSGDMGVGGAGIAANTSSDRVFHLDLEDPMRPSPPDAGTVPAGNVVLSWANRSPNIGADVWVDVWFGTNAGSLTRVVTTGLNTSSQTVSAAVGGTYYWRIDSYLDGAPTGTPLTGTLFRFFVADTDGDGLPDSYELANTIPPSATALTPGGDDDGDNLTNLGEYQLGTRANIADTDGDGLNDGAEVIGAGARPATKPLLGDTDGDGISDAAESSTGVWVNASNTGTDPTKADTDGDALRDGVETQTRVYLNATNTGTSPLLADTDGDDAGDWYEITASYTDPNNAAEKPNIPYPLPRPDGSTGATNKPVKVFILSGQSNMVGMGDVGPAKTPGTLATIVHQEGKFPNLAAVNGNWTVRSDVMYRGVISAIGKAPLTVGQGSAASAIGPELGFGQVMGWYFDEPVLLIKSSIGNRSLLWDCLPPGTLRFNYNGKTYAGYGDSPNSWPIGGSPSPYVWYAGKQYDDYFLAEPDMGPKGWAAAVTYSGSCQVRHNGVVYLSKSAHTSATGSEPGIGANWMNYWGVYSVFNVTDVLDNWAAEYPAWAAQGFEIAGFVWWQGNKDIGSGSPNTDRYETNLVQFIKQIRGYYQKRYPGHIKTNAPFVLATGCGDPQTSGNGLAVANAQLAVSGERGKYREFAGNVKTMDSRGYWRGVTESPVSQGYHYNRNAETYVLTGDALGRGMVELLSAAPGKTVFIRCGPLSGTSLSLTFAGPNGQSYQLLTSTNVGLPTPSWSALTSGTFGSGAVTYTDSIATKAQKFYRIKSP